MPAGIGVGVAGAGVGVCKDGCWCLQAQVFVSVETGVGCLQGQKLVSAVTCGGVCRERCKDIRH